MKHFLFQTRFWFILEELLNIWKITSSQITSTVQRPFWGPFSLGHSRKTVTPAQEGAVAGGFIQVPHSATDSLWCSVQEGPSPQPKNAALPRWLWRTAMVWGTNTMDWSSTEAGKYSSSAVDPAQSSAGEFQATGVTNCMGWSCSPTRPSVWKHPPCTDGRLHPIHTPAANACQRSPEVLKPRETPSNNPVNRCIRIWRAHGRPAWWKCIIFFIYTTEKEKDG